MDRESKVAIISITSSTLGNTRLHFLLAVYTRTIIGLKEASCKQIAGIPEHQGEMSRRTDLRSNEAVQRTDNNDYYASAVR